MTAEENNTQQPGPEGVGQQPAHPESGAQQPGPHGQQQAPPPPPSQHPRQPHFTGPDPDIRRFLTVAFGILLIVVGISMFGGLAAWRALDVFGPLRTYWGDLRQVLIGGALLIAGIALIIYRDRLHVRLPSSDRRLYRSRDHKMIAGVVGGLADYFGTDPTLLRLIVVALAFLLDFWPFFVAYIVAAIVIPQEPEAGAQQAPGSGTPPAPPAR